MYEIWGIIAVIVIMFCAFCVLTIWVITATQEPSIFHIRRRRSRRISNAELQETLTIAYNALSALGDQPTSANMSCHNGLVSADMCSHCGPIIDAREAMVLLRRARTEI